MGGKYEQHSVQVLAGSGGELDAELVRRWEERQAGVRLLQTVCKLLAGVLLRSLLPLKRLESQTFLIGTGTL